MLGDIVRRLVFAIAAVAAIGLAEERRLEGDELYGIHFDFHWPSWWAWVGLLILAGLFLGLAAREGFPRARGYRWWVPLVVGLPPALLLGRFLMVFRLDRPIIQLPFGPWMNTPTQGALALMVGVAIAAGFRSAPHEDPGPAGSAEEDPGRRSSGAR